MFNPMYKAVAKTDDGDDDDARGKEKPATSFSRLASSKKRLATTAKENQEMKSALFEEAKAVNRASVGVNTAAATRKVFKDVSSTKQACNSSIMVISASIALLCGQCDAHRLSSSHDLRILVAPRILICACTHLRSVSCRLADCRSTNYRPRIKIGSDCSVYCELNPKPLQLLYAPPLIPYAVFNRSR